MYMHRKVGRQAGRQAGRQTDRQTDIVGFITFQSKREPSLTTLDDGNAFKLVQNETGVCVCVFIYVCAEELSLIARHVHLGECICI
jgi:hypothetical protein